MPDKEKKSQNIPDGYVQLKGSERRTQPTAKVVGEVDSNESFSATIVLRRRPDGPSLPGFDHFAKTTPRQRRRLSHEEFTEKHGAHPDEIKAIEEFAKRNGLTVKESHIGRRHVVVHGTAEQFSKAFAVSFRQYQVEPHDIPPHKKGRPTPSRTYRGREGFIHVPKDLADSIVGVFGLDNRPIGGKNLAGDTPITNLVSVQQAAALYNFPAPGASIGGQTIGIVSAGGGVGYLQSDINLTFGATGLSSPIVHDIAVDGVTNLAAAPVTSAASMAGGNTLTFTSTGGLANNSIGYYISGGNYFWLQVTAVTATTLTVSAYDSATGNFDLTLQSNVPVGTSVYFNLDGETMQDLAIAGMAAPGTNLACYFLNDSQAGWVDMIGRVLHPNPGDFPAGVNPPSVLSSSYFISGGDDPDGLTTYGVTTALMDAISQAFEDAAHLQNGPTICIATGDRGSDNRVGNNGRTPASGDGFAHVQYPASDPWVLSVGGTTLGQYIPAGSTTPAWVEFPWNATDATWGWWGASGGGVSDYFPLPSYQNLAGVPNSINPGIAAPNPHTVVPPAAFKATGRGVPDVAANANERTGFSGIAFAGVLGGQIGNGTSASAPFWAGLIAALNSNVGFNIGFANPTLYALGSGAFNPINPLWRDPSYSQLASCPTDNGNNTIPGYATRAGWDAVTGLGSPNGMQILSGFTALEMVYILGGYQSADVILTDLTTGSPVPIGGLPGGPWDTLLRPSTNYGFSANVHNDSPNAVAGVVVKFWAIPGGVGTSGTMVGAAQTVSIPPHSTVTVNASAQFTSAPLGDHMCAVVSIYSPTTGCNVNAATALDIPDPGYSETHQCSAWRNTDSTLTGGGNQFHFRMGLGRLPIRMEKPVILQIAAKHVPADIREIPAVAKIADTLRAMGARSNIPYFLLPGIIQSFKSVNLKTSVKEVGKLSVRQLEGGVWHLLPHNDEEKNMFEIEGHVPANAKVGDVMLVYVTAKYPKIKERESRTVEFLQFVHVVNKKK